MNKILVIEDTPSIREEICDILKMEDFLVFEASNGIEGLDAVKQTLPNLIISDISMPKLDGYGFLAELKKNIKTENIPVIFLSAKSDLKDIRKGMNLGAADYLTKPLSADDLITAVNLKLESKSKNEKKLNEVKMHIAQFMPHELITPLNGILGLSEYLNDFYPVDKDELNHIAKSIHSCGERLAHLIQNYLLYTNLMLESSTTGDIYNNTDIMLIDTNDLIILASKNIEKNRINDIVLQIENITLKFSKLYYSTIIEELLNNAVKFSKPGSKINISSRIIENNYSLKFETLGKGISSEQIEEIGAFVQFNRKYNEQQGIGLGLEIVRLITSLNGGKLIIDSIPDQYFNITVLLPL